MNTIKYDEFSVFWHNEIEKKLFRCAKEFGFYSRLWLLLNKKNYFYTLYTSLMYEIIQYEEYVVDFSNMGVKRKFTVKLAEREKKHLSQLLIFKLFSNCGIGYETFSEAFQYMDSKIYEGQLIKTSIKEKWSLLKIFFR